MTATGPVHDNTAQHAGRMVAKLFDAVAGDRLTWLEELLAGTGLRCWCDSVTAMAGACPCCGGWPAVDSSFDAYRTTPEATLTVPPQSSGDPQLALAIGAAGAGNAGESYRDHNWIYSVWIGGTMVLPGVDLRCGGMPQTHAAMAVLLAEHAGTMHPEPGPRLNLPAHDPAGPGDPDA